MKETQFRVYTILEGMLSNDLDCFISINKDGTLNTYGCPTHYVSRFIGLLDKNKDKIFEEDIVKFKYTEELGKVVDLIGVFCYNEDELRYEIEIFGNSEYVVLSYVPNGVMFDFKIIGNIRENPELIK